jgi:hypothetical protein
MIVARRRTRVALAVSLALGAALAGCETIGRQARRSDSSGPPIVILDDGAKARAIGSDGDENVIGGSKGVVRSNRPGGAWSSEAQEIERSLGVGR